MAKASSKKVPIKALSKMRRTRMLNSVLAAQDALKKVIKDHAMLKEKYKWTWAVLPKSRYEQARSDMKALAEFIINVESALAPGEVRDDDC